MIRFDGKWIGLVLILALSRSLSAKPPLPEEKDADGKYPPGSPVGPYRGFGYDWENNDLGIDRSVPPPWTPILVEGYSARIWGRESTFRKRCFHVR